MSTIHKYVVLAALCLGALAMAPGTAAASTLTNHAQPWCMVRGTDDVHVISSASAALTWKPGGNLVLEPTSHFVPRPGRAAPGAAATGCA